MTTEQKRKKRSKKDIGLLVAILVVVVLIGLASIPIISSNVLSAKYKTFQKHYTESMNSSRKSGKVKVTDGAEEISCSVDAASQIYGLIFDAGMGKKQKKIPEGEGIQIIFTDGTSILFLETDIPEKSALRDKGVFVRYEGADGYLYQYDTDQLTMDAIRGKIKPE